VRYGIVNVCRAPERVIKKGSSNARRIPERGIKKGLKMRPRRKSVGVFIWLIIEWAGSVPAISGNLMALMAGFDFVHYM